MTAFMIVTAEIINPEPFMAYAKKAAELVAEFGGRYVVRGPGHSECLEGDWPDARKVVVSKWPSIEAAKSFWTSDAYAEAKKLREGHAIVAVRLVEGDDYE